MAELGILGLTTPDGGGSVTTVAAAMESLGNADAGSTRRDVHRRPATRRGRAAVATGDEVVAVKTSETIGWLPIAPAVIELDAGHAFAHVSPSRSCRSARSPASRGVAPSWSAWTTWATPPVPSQSATSPPPRISSARPITC